MTLVQEIPDIDSLLIGLYGDIKTGKTSFMLSMPKPLVDFDFDQSFDRAAARALAMEKGLTYKKVMPEEELTDEILAKYDIIVRCYDMPLQLPGRPLEGFVNLWEEKLIPEFMKTLETPRIKSVGLDTGTLFWTIDHQAQLERVQRESSNKVRQRLLPVEYARPNTEARALLGAVRNKRKNLVALHHVGPKHGPGYETVRRGRTEEKVFKPDMLIGETWSGFSHLGQIVDVIARTRLEQNCETCKSTFVDNPASRMEHGTHKLSGKVTPTVEIEHCGYSLNAGGMKFENASFDLLYQAINGMRLADVTG